VYELLPLILGVVLGAGLHRAEPVRFRSLIVTAVSIAVGITVSSLAGELAESPLFALWDGFQCAAATYLVIALAPLWARRRA
jgi:hypothetical protein